MSSLIRLVVLTPLTSFVLKHFMHRLRGNFRSFSHFFANFSIRLSGAPFGISRSCTDNPSRLVWSCLLCTLLNGNSQEKNNCSGDIIRKSLVEASLLVPGSGAAIRGSSHCAHHYVYFYWDEDVEQSHSGPVQLHEEGRDGEARERQEGESCSSMSPLTSKRSASADSHGDSDLCYVRLLLATSSASDKRHCWLVAQRCQLAIHTLYLVSSFSYENYWCCLNQFWMLPGGSHTD